MAIAPFFGIGFTGTLLHKAQQELFSAGDRITRLEQLTASLWMRRWNKTLGARINVEENVAARV